MSNDTKSVVTEIANAALMITPEIPTIGPVLTGVLAGGLALWDIFFPDDSDVVGDPPVTSDDLDNAVQALKTFITQNNFSLIIDNAEIHVATLDNSLTDDWTFVTAAVLDPNDQMTEDDKLIEQYKTFLTPLTGTENRRTGAAKPIEDHDSNLSVAITIFQHWPDYRHLSLPLFLYAGNIKILYYKLNIMWDYRTEVADQTTYPELHDALASQIKAQDKTLLADTRTWMKGGRKGPSPLEQRIKKKILIKSPYVDELNLCIESQTDGLFMLLDGYIKDIEAAYAARDAKIAARRAQVVVQQKNGAYEVIDNGAGGKVVATQTLKKLADINAENYAGTFTAAINKAEIVDKHFDGYDPDYIATLKKIRDHWGEVNSGALDFINDYTQNLKSQPG